MVASIVGDYLLNKGYISKEQLQEILEEQQKVRVKLGLIAVAEGLLTQDEADKINELQSAMDKRFGDIAVEKNFLTSGQVDALLKKQGNAYLAFAQVLENKQIMTIDQLEQYMVSFQRDKGLTISDMEDLKSDDVDRILPLFMPKEFESYMNIAGTALRTIMRCVDTLVYPEKAYMANELKADKAALQYMEGDHDTTCAMAGSGEALLPVACIFGKEDFPEVNMDALDAIAELINCINGLYASAVSQNGVSMELCPPEFSDHIKCVSAEEMLILPLHIKDQLVDFIIALDNRIGLKQEA